MKISNRGYYCPKNTHRHRSLISPYSLWVMADLMAERILKRYVRLLATSVMLLAKNQAARYRAT